MPRPNKLLERLSWNDLHLCLMVGRLKTVSAAGQALGLSHSTVLRRIAVIEEHLGVVLFRKLSNGYEPTEFGRQLLQSAERIELQVADAVAGISGHDERMAGIIRLSVPDLAAGGLMGIIRGFCERHPELAVHFEVSQTPQGLTLGEADVALALVDAPPQGQIGYCVGPAAFAVYIATGIADKLPEPTPWVGLDRALHHTPVGQLDRRLAEGYRVVHRASSVAVHYSAIREGLGMGLLACGVADLDPALRRCGALIIDPVARLWVLSRKEYRDRARVAVFARHLRDALFARRALIAGEQPLREPLDLVRAETSASDVPTSSDEGADAAAA